MKRMILGMSVVAAMLFAASAALAGGLNLAWTNCASEGGLPNRVGACTANTGSNILTGSFVPTADVAGVTGIEVVLDFIVGDGVSAIPPWWEVNGVGACRSGALGANSQANGNNTICNDWAGGQGLGGLAAYNAAGVAPDGSVNPANASAHRRAIIGIAVAIPVDLVATEEYFAFNAAITNVKSVGTGSCAGCTTPVCVVLNSINVVPGTNAGQLIGNGTAANSNFATWQGVGPSCSLVPTKNATWGSVKALYH